MSNLAIVVATVRDPKPGHASEYMKIIIAERVRDTMKDSVLELPSTLSADFKTMEEAAENALRIAGYDADEFVFLNEGAIQPESSDQIASFWLAVNAKRHKENPYFTVHEVPIVHIGPWVSGKKLMVAPTVWAGIYLRISHLLTHPHHGTVQ